MTWGVNSYNATPSGNSTINGINIAEGCNASGINDAIRQLMADLAVPTFAGTVTFPDAGTWSSSGVSSPSVFAFGPGGTGTSGFFPTINGGNGVNASTGLKILSNGVLSSDFYYDVNSAETRIGSGTKDPAVTIKANTGVLAFKGYGAGTLTTDASGNVTASSDATLKNVLGPYQRGLADILKIDTSLWEWNEASNMDGSTVQASYTAQAVQAGLPEAVSVGPDGKLTVFDGAIIAALINAVKELASR